MIDPLTQSVQIDDWFAEHYRLLLRYLGRRLGSNDPEVEDLAQETFLRLLRLERTELIRNPQAYLRQVAVSVMLDWRLRASRRQPHSSELTESLAGEMSAEQDAVAHLNRRLMQRAIRQVPPLCQAVLYLRAQEDLSNQEIAERLGVTRRMVKRSLEAGYAQLRDILSTVNL